MQGPNKISAALLAGIIIAAGFVSIAWFQAPENAVADQNGTDTLPKREKKVRKEKEKQKTIVTGNLNEQLEELDNALDHLDQQLQNTDWNKINSQLRESIEKIDPEKMQRQIENALKDIDLQKIQLETDAALKKVDWDKMQQSIQRAMTDAKNSLDSKKINAELQRALEQTQKAMADARNSINVDKIHGEMDQAQQELRKQQVELRQQQVELRNECRKAQQEIKETMHRDMKKDLEKAKADLQRSKAELQAYKAMLDEMEKDGLLNSKEKYSIEYKNGDLFINESKQPDSIRDKYRHYFKTDDIKIKNSPNGGGNDNDDEGIGNEAI